MRVRASERVPVHDPHHASVPPLAHALPTCIDAACAAMALLLALLAVASVCAATPSRQPMSVFIDDAYVPAFVSTCFD